MGWTPPPDHGIDVPEWACHRPLEPEGASTMKIKTVGIDLAKNVFQVHGVNEHGKAILRKQPRRDQVAVFFENLPPCLVGMEACASAHHWARKLATLGHTVRLMAPQFEKKKPPCGGFWRRRASNSRMDRPFPVGCAISYPRPHHHPTPVA